MTDLVELDHVDLVLVSGLNNANHLFGKLGGTYRLGHCWFQYQYSLDDPTLYCGRVQYINFPQQRFFPDGPYACNFIWEAVPGVVLTGTPKFKHTAATLRVEGQLYDAMYAIAGALAAPLV